MSDPRSSDEDRARFMRWLLAFFMVVVLVYGVSPIRWHFDDYLAFPTAQSMVGDGDLDLDEYSSPSVREHYGFGELPGDGHANLYPWTVSLLLVPTVAVVDAGSALIGTPSADRLIEDDRTAFLSSLTASFVTALAAALVALIAWERLATGPVAGDRSRRWLALFVGTAFAFGSAAWSTASRAMWQHGPAMLAFAVAVLVGQRIALGVPGNMRARAAVMGAALAAAYTFRPTNAIAVIGVLVWVALCQRRLLVAFIAGGATVGLVWMLVNLATWHQPLQPYHADGGLVLHGDYGTAVAANLISPARGLLIYSPIVLAGVLSFLPAVTRSKPVGVRSFDLMLGLVVVAVLLAVSAFGENWWAGHSYGPRFLADTSVFQFTLATSSVALLVQRLRGPVRSRLAVVGVCAVALAFAWSVFVNSQGAWSQATQCWNSHPDIDQNSWRAWDWDDPQFLTAPAALIESGSIHGMVFTNCG